MATETNLEMYRGEDITVAFTMSPVETITGWTLTFNVALSQNTTTKAITKTCSIVSGAGGTFSAAIAAADTTSLELGSYVWDVWRTDSGSRRLLGFGRFKIMGGARLP